MKYYELRSNGKNYVKGEGGKFAGSRPGSGSGGQFKKKSKKDLTNEADNDTINSCEFVSSLLGTGKNYPVIFPGSGHIKLDTTKDIDHIKVFAGKGTSKEIRTRFDLESTYHIKAENWQKCSGFGYVIDNGKSVKVELHWYHAHGKRAILKVKKPVNNSQVQKQR